MRRGQPAQQADRNAARAGAKIADGWTTATRSNQIQREFNQHFSLWPGNQHSRRDFKIETEKLLVARNVLQRLASSAPIYQLLKHFAIALTQHIFCMSDDEAAV